MDAGYPGSGLKVFNSTRISTVRKTSLSWPWKPPHRYYFLCVLIRLLLIAIDRYSACTSLRKQENELVHDIHGMVDHQIRRRARVQLDLRNNRHKGCQCIWVLLISSLSSSLCLPHLIIEDYRKHGCCGSGIYNLHLHPPKMLFLRYFQF